MRMAGFILIMVGVSLRRSNLYMLETFCSEYEQPLILQVQIFKKDGIEKTTGTSLESECEIEDSDCRKSGLKTPRMSEPDFPSTRPNYCSYEKQCEAKDTDVLETDDQCRERAKYFDRGKVSVTKKSGVRYVLTWRKVPHLYYYLTFPRAIITRKTISNDETVILKDHEGNSWRMKLRARAGGRVDLVQGWKEFLIENDVSNGDILIFEFVSSKDIQIHIKRAREQGCENPPKRAKKTKTMVSDDTRDEPVVNAAIPNDNLSETEVKTERVFFDDFTSSSFSVIWKHWNTTKACYLHIPGEIAIEQKLKNEDTILLCDLEGIQWPVKIGLEPSDGRLGLAQGWIVFWGQHKVSYGDTLAFLSLCRITL